MSTLAHSHRVASTTLTSTMLACPFWLGPRAARRQPARTASTAYLLRVYSTITVCLLRVHRSHPVTYCTIAPLWRTKLVILGVQPAPLAPFLHADPSSALSLVHPSHSAIWTPYCHHLYSGYPLMCSRVRCLLRAVCWAILLSVLAPCVRQAVLIIRAPRDSTELLLHHWATAMMQCRAAVPRCTELQAIDTIVLYRPCGSCSWHKFMAACSHRPAACRVCELAVHIAHSWPLAVYTCLG
jgi:hypothetical protein